MPYTTSTTLRRAAGLLSVSGLHTGEQFIDQTSGALDVSAAIYWAAHSTEQPPVEFATDEVASLRLIECSAPAMQAIRTLSDSLDTGPCVTQIAPGYDVPDYIEHVSNWAATTPVFDTRPPSTSEVIGALLRAANAAAALIAPHQLAA